MADRAGMVVVSALLFAGMAGPADARTISRAVELDGDPHVERVDRVLVRCPRSVNASNPCGFIRVVDGPMRRQLTSLTQRPRLNYGWRPYSPVRLADLTGDGLPEIVWNVDTAGGTGSSPRLFGVHRWTGTAARRLLSRTTRGTWRSWVQPVALDVLPPVDGLRELLLTELLYGADDSTCCPSYERTQRYRWDGGSLVLVPGSTSTTVPEA